MLAHLASYVVPDTLSCQCARLPGAVAAQGSDDDSGKVGNMHSKRFDVEHLGPDLRALSMRHSVEELKVVARLASGAARSLP